MGSKQGGDWVRYLIGLIGAAIGFIIGKWDTLLDIFVGTSVAVTAAADLGPFGPKWQVRIRGLSSDTTQFQRDFPLTTAVRRIAINPGLYSVSLLQADVNLATKTEEVTRGTNRVVSFDRKDLEEAWRQHQKIEVRVMTDRSKYAPGEPIGLQITATGLGYLWIEELDDKSNITASYPPLDQEGQDLIGPTRAITFPNEKMEGFIAEKAPGNYQLICLVTSSPSHSDAERIFDEIRGISIKGYGLLANNWGYAAASYSVTPFR